MDYDYDLVSGKVNKVSYQYGKGDQFFYRYLYDAENRVTNAQTSRDGLTWINDASYRYYLHGPLARTELGQYKVQGMDYAYTLQGWLKGVNSSILDSSKDMGNDGKPGTMFGKISKDVMGFTLGYYNNDYKPIDITANAPAFGLAYQYPLNATAGASGKELFNGNISNTTVALSMMNNGLTRGYSYSYDQLNRLKAMNQHTLAARPSSWDNTSITDAYKEQVTYDANGNILSYIRNGANITGMPKAMDSLTYRYLPNSNKLDHADDAVPTANYSVDIDDQDTLNFKYDNIGNLISDVTARLSKIDWTVYGKIKSITKTTANSNINYYYDASGNRVVKDVMTSTDL